MHLIGVLLAAGRSQRMGQPKQLLPWPPTKTVVGLSEADHGVGSSTESASETPPTTSSKPLAAAAFDAIAPACCAMLVVAGHEVNAVVTALGERPFQPVRVDPHAEMLESVKAGLSAAREMDATADVLLQPADHPEVGRDTLDALVHAAAAHPGRAIMPEYEGSGGHPVLIPALLFAAIGDFTGPGGLRQFWRDHADQCVRLPVDDPGVVFDLDTQADYQSRA